MTREQTVLLNTYLMHFLCLVTRSRTDKLCLVLMMGMVRGQELLVYGKGWDEQCTEQTRMETRYRLQCGNVVCLQFVSLNNSFRRIFNCCWRESPKFLLYYCRTLPIVPAVDQRRILFYKKLKCHSSVLLRVLARICYREILSVATKYNIQCLDMSIGNIKNCIWKSFSDSVM